MRVFICGDIVNSNRKYRIIDEQLEKVIQSCDFAICNFEAPIYSDNQTPTNKAGASIFQCEDVLDVLGKSGFNIYSLANNHIFDYGEAGLIKTINEIESRGYTAIGAGRNMTEIYREHIVHESGLSVAIISAAENEFGCVGDKSDRPGYAWVLSHRFEDKIRELKRKVDKVIVISHAGLEDVDFPMEIWRDKYKRFIDIGADLIVGHHPHVPQGFEVYKNKKIFYSLGNFFFDYNRSNMVSDDSFSLVIEITKNNEIDVDIVYHRSNGELTELSSSDDVSFDMRKLNSLITDGYLERVNEICLEKYHQYYKNYYRKAMLLPKDNVKVIEWLKFYVKRFLFSDRMKFEADTMLLHNIQIDTHLYVVKKALTERLNNAKKNKK